MRWTTALLAVTIPLAACTTMPRQIMGKVQPGVTTDTEISQELRTKPIMTRSRESGNRKEVWAKRSAPVPFHESAEAFAGEFTAEGVLVRVTAFASTNPNQSADLQQQAQQ
ncbi:MAG: hypothetical protein HQL37_09060 [Alphaproteobacteria bacterium]|nr:hypothetical protein [Alphaproteobacteria bacterium]